jgi:ABC-2 type transport system ATP-binding protein
MDVSAHPTLNGLSFAVEEGEIFGIIGHNGAGKTTMFKLLLGLLRPSAGTVTFDGAPLTPDARAAIGFLPEHPYFYDYLTVAESLDFYARLYGMRAAARQQRIAEIVEQVQLGPKLRASLRTLSKGTLQRVGIAQAIMNQPRLVILDEPMSGLDPAGRHHMREIIQSLQHAGTTVIFSSHVLPDAEALCSRVGIIANGRLREIVVLNHARQPEAYVMAVTGVESETLQTLERNRLATAARQRRKLGAPSADVDGRPRGARRGAARQRSG